MAEDQAVVAPRGTRSRLRRYGRRMLITIAIVYVLVAVLLYWFQDAMIFPGASWQGTEAARVTPGADERLVTLAVPGGESVTAFYGPALSAEGMPLVDAAERPVIVYFYGN